jgi:hypothetical protein
LSFNVPSTLPSVAGVKTTLIAAVNRCATQNQVQYRVFGSLLGRIQKAVVHVVGIEVVPTDIASGVDPVGEKGQDWRPEDRWW